MTKANLDIDHSLVERNKQLRRDLWDYGPVDHIPFFPWVILVGEEYAAAMKWVGSDA